MSDKINQASQTDSPTEKPVKGAHRVLVLLIVLNIINMVDRNLISSFGPQITEELNLSDTQFGLLTGLLFVFFYAIMGLFVGRLADTMSRPKLIAAGLFIWSALTAYSGAARNFVQLSLARIFIGVGESALTPASMSMLSDLFPPSKRGMASGLYYLGVPLGAGASFLVAGIFGPKIGWRNCFYILGILGLVLTPLLFLLKDPLRGRFDKPSKMASIESEGVLHSLKLVWGLSKESPALKWAMIGGIFMHLSIGSGAFAITWLVRERGFDASAIASTYGGLFIVFGTLGIFIGGLASDWYLKRFEGGRLRFLAILMLCIAPFIVSYRFVSPESPLFYIGMCAGFLSFTAFYGPVFSTVQDLSPAKLRGVTTAVLLLMCNLVGIGLGAVFTGVLSDTFSEFGVSQPLSKALITIDIMGAMTVVSFFIGAAHWQRQQEKQIQGPVELHRS